MVSGIEELVLTNGPCLQGTYVLEILKGGKMCQESIRKEREGTADEMLPCFACESLQEVRKGRGRHRVEPRPWEGSEMFLRDGLWLQVCFVGFQT